MRNAGNMGIKVIAVMGVLAFLLLMLTSLGLKQSLKPNEAQRVAIRTKYSPFDRQRAFNDLERILSHGTRPSGSEGIEATRDYLKAELRRAGLGTRSFAGAAEHGGKRIALESVAAVVEGTRPGAMVIGVRMDTFAGAGPDFIGANGGGAATAWLLELARSLGKKRQGRSLWLLWYDGMELSEGGDALPACQYAADRLKTAEDIVAVLHVGRIGDCYLGIMRTPGASASIEETLWDTAQRLGYGAHFGRHALETDAVFPDFGGGVAQAVLVDYAYGGGLIEHRQRWQTEADTLDLVCPESLQAVADVLYHALPVLDSQLEAAGNG